MDSEHPNDEYQNVSLENLILIRLTLEERLAKQIQSVNSRSNASSFLAATIGVVFTVVVGFNQSTQFANVIGKQQSSLLVTIWILVVIVLFLISICLTVWNFNAVELNVGTEEKELIESAMYTKTELNLKIIDGLRQSIDKNVKYLSYSSEYSKFSIYLFCFNLTLFGLLILYCSVVSRQIVSVSVVAPIDTFPVSSHVKTLDKSGLPKTLPPNRITNSSAFGTGNTDKY